MKCNHCGWNNNSTDKYCIKCGNLLPVNNETIAGKSASSVSSASPETIRGAAAPPLPSAETVPAHASRETIDPYRIQTPPPKEFFLQRLDEKDAAPVILSFSAPDELVEFNRANLDAENRTITSKVQARVTFSDGKWHIIDCSEKKSTFIRVSEQHELKDGDILVIGNKRFIFSLTNPKNQ
ncbi:MAG: FHA domain-containing protein [Bacteroidetes bacterium]|nr:FHA domain-containing protein [Bacteroidota bacterium]